MIMMIVNIVMDLIIMINVMNLVKVINKMT